MNDKLTMTVQDIMDLGFSKWTAYNILRQAKHIMVGLEELHVKN